MDKLNLQSRLAIIFAGIFLLGIGSAFTRSLYLDEQRVKEALLSTSELVNRMFTIAEIGGAFPFSRDTEDAFFRELLLLENNREIDIRISSRTADYPDVNDSVRAGIEAPDWFVDQMYPDSLNEIRIFVLGNGDVVTVYPDPGEIIEQVWDDTKSRLWISGALFLLLLIIMTYLLQRWIRPIAIIKEVLETVEHGDFSRRIPRFSLPELRQFGEKINHLTTWLGASKTENERLTRKSITVQERERRYLAQELHDSLGQAVSAIKAIAVSIEERAGDKDPICGSSARNIEEIADSAYKSVRNLMTSLRPSVLDELGLVAALNHMVDDWNTHHEDTFCRLRIDGNYDNLQEEVQINVYRIVQEALTNVSKYAKAENVTITLSGNEIISLLIMDDGIGFAMNEVARSMGLTGIRDRVTLLRGELDIASRPGRGVSIQIEFPRVNYFRRRSGDR